MKTIISKTLLVLLFATTLTTLGNNHSNSNSRKPYNVKDFGAVGDGKTDDTDAIQRCITYVEAKNRPYFKAETAFPKIIFPTGNYLISRPIIIAAKRQAMNLTIQGENDVTITQKNTDADIFYMHYGYRQTVRNITFNGGRTHIRFFSRNFNRAQLLIEDCHFIHSSDYAVDDAMHGTHHSKIIAPYEIAWKNSLPYAVEVDLDKNLPDIFYTSTILRINRCQFVDCMKIARIFADWGIISNCEITTHREMQNAAIYSRGVLKIKDSNFFCKINKGQGQRLIDNINAGILLSNVTVDTDGIGICPIFNRRIYDNGGLYNVYAVIDNCNIKAGGSPENCFVYCEEVPNLISITNSSETSGNKIPAIGFRQQITKEYLEHVSFPQLVKRLPELARIYGFMASMPRVYTICEEKYKHNFSFILYNNKQMDSRLPDVLSQHVEKPLPANVEKVFNRNPIKFTKLQHGQVINVQDYGAKGDGKHDDASAIQRAVDFAGEHGLNEVNFPSGVYKISTAIILPSRIALRGLGLACLAGDAQTETLLVGSDVRYAFFSDIGFFNAKIAVDVQTMPDINAEISFNHCFFSKISETAVRCQSGKNMISGKNFTNLGFFDCVFGIAGQATITNARLSVFECCWFSFLQKQNANAKFVNYGKMLIYDCIGVPSIEAQTTWFDNHNTLLLDNMRFGGEGKFPKYLISNKALDGKIFMKNSWVSCTTGTVVRCDKNPQLVVLIENFGPPDKTRQIMLETNLASSENRANFLFERNNIIPNNISPLR